MDGVDDWCSGRADSAQSHGDGEYQWEENHFGSVCG